jgi:triacylglycerol lipase
VAAVPPSGSIEARSAKLAESIALKAKGKQVNIIAYVGLYLSLRVYH